MSAAGSQAPRPDRDFVGQWVAEVWHSRGILYFLAWRDVNVRYKQAALGVAWALLQPLFTMITFAFFFGKLAGIPSDGVPYPLFSYSALLLWTYFSVTLSQVGNSLIANSSLITHHLSSELPATSFPGLAGFESHDRRDSGVPRLLVRRRPGRLGCIGLFVDRDVVAAAHW